MDFRTWSSAKFTSAFRRRRNVTNSMFRRMTAIKRGVSPFYEKLSGFMKEWGTISYWVSFLINIHPLWEKPIDKTGSDVIENCNVNRLKASLTALLESYFTISTLNQLVSPNDLQSPHSATVMISTMALQSPSLIIDLRFSTFCESTISNWNCLKNYVTRFDAVHCSESDDGRD